jgi:Ca-activated chloride channel family protein
MEEVTMLDFNQTRPAGVDKLVALYPAEGTFYSDDPYLVLNAPWVSAGQKRAAAVFGAWLEKKLTPQLAAKYGFRPGDPNLKPVAPITKANGANPALPTRLLALPEPRVLAKIKAAWHADRKPANVMLVVDTSGSMYEEGKLAQAKRGLQVFLKQLSPRDRVGLTWFNDSIHKAVQIAPFSTNRNLLVRAVDALAADGNTAVYDATSEGVRAVAALSDNSRINAVVVLTDGQDTASHDNLADVISSLRSGGDETHKVRVFTIAYGASADERALAQIAEAGGGKAYVGDPKSIEKVYIGISSFF